MSEKELIIKAIDSYSFYTTPQRLLLKTLYQLSNDNCIYESVAELGGITKISRASVYRMLSIFQKDGIVSYPSQNSVKLNQIILNSEKLDQIKESYIKKSNLKHK